MSAGATAAQAQRARQRQSKCEWNPCATTIPDYLLMVAATLFAGCKKGAEQFFSGRPSEMSMLHNRIIGGPPATIVELLRVGWVQVRDAYRSKEKAKSAR